MTAGEAIRFESEDRVATITLNRPDAGNSINDQLARELGTAWDRFRDDPGLDVAILTGAGESAFCLGADMRQMAGYFDAQQRGDDVGSQPIAVMDAMRPRQHGITKPVLCAVNGRCAGIGLAFLTECDIILASDRAAFTDPHVTWGGTSSPVLVGLVGRLPLNTILRLGLLGKGEWLSAERAYELGLVGEVTTPADLMPRARALAARIVAANQPAVRAQKEAIWKALDTLLHGPEEAAREVGARFAAETRFANIAAGTAEFTGQRPAAQPE
jgi:enoyl-CoA hydratase/carnithine racemase